MSESTAWFRDGPCYYCNEPTESNAGNPGLWPVLLCHSDDPGKVKHHHVRCVSNRLAEFERLKEAWDALPRSEAVDQLIASRAEVKRLKAEVDLRERQMALAAKYISRYYEAMRNPCTTPSEKEHSLLMVDAIGTDMKNILEKADGEAEGTKEQSDE